jgi:hypothetical protein
MLYVINNNLNEKHFVDTNKTLDEFAMEIITDIRKDNPCQAIQTSFGFHNVHIKIPGTLFDTWFYNSKHPIYKRAIQEQELNIVTIK